MYLFSGAWVVHITPAGRGDERGIELSRQGLAARSGGEQKWHAASLGYRTLYLSGEEMSQYDSLS